MTQYLNKYQCYKEVCTHQWTEVYSCGCDSECPKCGSRDVSPYDSDEINEYQRNRESREGRRSA